MDKEFRDIVIEYIVTKTLFEMAEIEDLIKMIEPLTNEDIEEYALFYLTEESRKQGYTEEDYYRIVSTLCNYRDEYE